MPMARAIPPPSRRAPTTSAPRLPKDSPSNVTPTQRNRTDVPGPHLRTFEVPYSQKRIDARYSSKSTCVCSCSGKASGASHELHEQQLGCIVTKFEVGMDKSARLTDMRSVIAISNRSRLAVQQLHVVRGPPNLVASSLCVLPLPEAALVV